MDTSLQPRLDPRLMQRLTEKKTQLDRYRPLSRAIVRRLFDDLRVFLTYHSNAIEGNTLDLRETQMIIEHGVTIGGHSLREHLEATDHAAAFNKGRLAGQKRGGRWYSTVAAVERYRIEVEQQEYPRGRPPKNTSNG